MSKNILAKTQADFRPFFGRFSSPKDVFRPPVDLDHPLALNLGKNFIVEQFLTSYSLLSFFLKLFPGLNLLVPGR
jgi:hypothetical protein